MSNSAAVVPQSVLAKTPFQKFCTKFKKNWQLHLMIIFPLAYLILFSYIPLYGIQIAFKAYSPNAGIVGSEWVGFRWYEYFFGLRNWPQLVGNTLAISLYSILVGFPVPIILALIIHVNTGKTLKKVAQNVSYMRHFISLVVMIGILNTVLNPVTGFLGKIYELFGVVQGDDIRGSSKAFRHLYVWSGVWQGMGWSSIMYLSALSAVPDELHEAAKLDGASRLRRVWSVDLPTILPTICLMLIMRFGSIMSVGYQKAYLMMNNMNKDKSEIISVYVYTKGLQAGGEKLGFGTAIGLLNSVINMALVFLVNAITNWLSDNELGLF